MIHADIPQRVFLFLHDIDRGRELAEAVSTVVKSGFEPVDETAHQGLVRVGQKCGDGALDDIAAGEAVALHAEPVADEGSGPVLAAGPRPHRRTAIGIEDGELAPLGEIVSRDQRVDHRLRA